MQHSFVPRGRFFSSAVVLEGQQRAGHILVYAVRLFMKLNIEAIVFAITELISIISKIQLEWEY